jgi:hypothetical protein
LGRLGGLWRAIPPANDAATGLAVIVMVATTRSLLTRESHVGSVKERTLARLVEATIASREGHRGHAPMGDEDDVPDRITREVVLPTSGTQELPRAARAPPSKVPASVGQGARLVVLSGADAGRKYLLQTRAVIGRAGGLEIQLRDSLVSRVHAEIARAPAGQFTIHDRGSRHGTRLNGRVVTASPTPLAFGDRIQIGGTDLVFTYRDPAEEALEEHEQLETLGRLGAALVHDMNNAARRVARVCR